MIVVGFDFTMTSYSLLASLKRRSDAIAASISAHESITGVVILATCARFEVYVDSPRFHSGRNHVMEVLTLEPSLMTSSLSDLVFVHSGDKAMRHLFRVAAGLESAVVGEDQILGQVRTARRHACTNGTSSPVLDRAFEHAVRAGRRARQHLAPASIAGVALDYASEQHHPGFGIGLVIGTGQFAQVSARELRERGAHTIYVFSPTGRSADFGTPINPDELAEALVHADVVVTASGHGEPVLSTTVVAPVLDQRGPRLIIIDLAPGDTDQALLEDPRVNLVGLRDVQGRGVDVERAAAIIEADLASSLDDFTADELGTLIVELRDHIARVADAAAPPDQTETARRIANAILHLPMLRARQAAESGDIDRVRNAIETLFGMPSKVST